MAQEPKDEELLLPFEMQTLKGEYRDYYKARRNNLFSSICGFREMWHYYMLLEDIWFREIGVIQNADKATNIFPPTIYMNVHAKLRIVMELAFSGCLQEARSLLRDAIEFTAHAHHMLKDPEFQKIWLSKDPTGKDEAFSDVFDRYKKDRLFKDLDELYQQWGQLSETGSHATPAAMAGRVTYQDTPTGKVLTMSYTGWEQNDWALSLFSMLLTCFVIEDTFYHDFEHRFSQDQTLVKMRQDFAVYKETLRRTITARYQVQPPAQHP